MASDNGGCLMPPIIQLGLPDHHPHAARPRGVGPGWHVLPRAHTRLSERVEFRRQLSEDRLGRPRPAHGVPRRGPVDHHVTRAYDRGRGVPDRSTLLADCARNRTWRDVRRPDPLEPENHEQYSQFETLALPGRGLGPGPTSGGFGSHRRGTAAGPMIGWVPSEHLPRRPEVGELYRQNGWSSQAQRRGV